MTFPPPEDGPTPPEQSLTDWISAENVVVPDDISSLGQDVARYRQERKHQRREAMAARVLPARLRRFGPAAPLVIITLVLLGSFGASMMLFGPRVTTRTVPTALPLARPTVPAGRIGGLLPAASVTRADGTPVAVADLTRPAVLTLIPAGCGCDGDVQGVTDTAAAFALTHYVVTASGAEGRRYLVGNSPPDQPLVDSGRALLAAFGGDGMNPTVVVLGRDGTVQAITPGHTDRAVLTEELQKAFGPSLSTPLGG